MICLSCVQLHCRRHSAAVYRWTPTCLHRFKGSERQQASEPQTKILEWLFICLHVRAPDEVQQTASTWRTCSTWGHFSKEKSVTSSWHLEIACVAFLLWKPPQAKNMSSFLFYSWMTHEWCTWIHRWRWNMSDPQRASWLPLDASGPSMTSSLGRRRSSFWPAICISYILKLRAETTKWIQLLHSTVQFISCLLCLDSSWCSKTLPAIKTEHELKYDSSPADQSPRFIPGAAGHMLVGADQPMTHCVCSHWAIRTCRVIRSDKIRWTFIS